MRRRYLLLSAVVLGMALGLSLALYRTQCGRATCLTPPTVVTNKCEILHSPTPATDTNSTVVVTNATPVVVTNAPSLPVNLNPQTTNAVKRPASRPRRVPTTYAPDVPKSRQVLLANRRIVVKEGRSFPKTFCAAQSPTARGTAPYVVISELPVSRDVRIRATADGARVIGFLPNNALLVEADAQALKNLEDDVLFMAAVEYEPMDKIQRNLLDAKPDESVEATIVLLNEADRATVQYFITDAGGKLLTGTPTNGKAIMAEVPSAVLTKLAGKAEVKWIEKFGRPKLLNDQAVLPQVMNVTPVWNTHGLTGEGQIIASLDTGIDTGNISTLNADFSGRIVSIYNIGGYTTVDYSGHGTHTAGSLVGTGANSSGKFKGVAYGARLYVLAGGDTDGTGYVHFDNIDKYEDIIHFGRNQYGYGVKSDSWGNDACTSYDFWCNLCDETIWGDSELLDIFAAGNDGWYELGTIDSPAAAKNCLAVGMTGGCRTNYVDIVSDDTIYDISMRSSLGPTSDGRIKPDVCAPGQYVVSVASSKAIFASREFFDASKRYVYMSGTSMATPLSAGCAALVREWLMKYKGYAETKPTAALMKAILTGGAFDIYDLSKEKEMYKRGAPNNFYGWGRVDLEASIFPTNGLAVYMKDRLPFVAGTNFAFTVVTTNAASLRAQLVWIDHAAEQLAGPMINNNLDLAVSSTIGGEKKIWYGNGGKAPDELNTVESVRIENAMPGRYVVNVTCPTIPYDYTEGGAAAIYIRGAFDPKDVAEGPSPLLYYIAQGKVL